MGREWDFYRTNGGASPVQKELAKCKLTKSEQARLKMLMDRVKRGATLPGDVKSIGKDLLEVRLDGDRRIFRLVYAEEEDGLLLLGLTFFQKKSQATPLTVKRTASKRLKDWRERSTDG
ncbi:type II toxin-antitoxin system RelE/ParE family toxin [Streptomyces sp. NPDC093681]|uniref:type II toxin-antitoxin system RelE/ParE family toxin n=1 Tax=Streptomyces sp. NPDC093681 TaxID=3155202 RepID=UPI00342628C6